MTALCTSDYMELSPGTYNTSIKVAKKGEQATNTCIVQIYGK